MTPVFQTLWRGKGDDHGNCVQAAVASILDLALDQVEDFVGVHNHAWEHGFEDWLRERGIEFIRLNGEWAPEGFYLAVGESPRGVRHMVVMNNGALVHDPHPEGGGVKIDSVYLLVPLDPSVLLKRAA